MPTNTRNRFSPFHPTRSTFNRRQGFLDLTGDAPLTLADDPDIELGDLVTVPSVGRAELHEDIAPDCCDDHYPNRDARGRHGYMWPHGQAGVDSPAMRP